MPTALIVGAGIGGLAAGIALRGAGWEVRVFETAPTPRAVGFALVLASNATAALSELGIADAVVSECVTPRTGEFRCIDGRVIRRFEGQLDDPLSSHMPRPILRSVLHRALFDSLGSRFVELNRAAVRFHADNRRVQLELADGTSATGDILVGADGLGSTVRRQLHAGAPPAVPSGYFALRGLSSAVGRMNGMHAIWYFGRGVEGAMIQASQNSIYWFVSLLAEEARRGSLEAERVMRDCTAGFDRDFQAIAGVTSPADIRLDELTNCEPLRSWGVGPITLLGDAAHPMLPHTGQGAAQALEDAVAIGRVMALGGDHVAALRRYEQVRSKHTRRLVKMGPRIARITTTKNPVVNFLRDTAIRIVPGLALAKALTWAGPDPYRGLGRG